MSDQTDDFMNAGPTLTLDPEGGAPEQDIMQQAQQTADAAGQQYGQPQMQQMPQYQQAPQQTAAPNQPDLTLDPFQQAPAAPQVFQQAPVKAANDVDDMVQYLNQQEKNQVKEFAKKIDFTNTQVMMNYGAGTQKKMAGFSERVLQDVRTKDMGEVGGMITSLVTELKNFDIDEDDGKILGFFKKRKNNLNALQAKYSSVEKNVSDIQNKLEEHQVTLMKDSAMLDKMYAANTNYFKELTMYIAAGKMRLEEVRNNDLAELQKKAEESGSPVDAQKARDLASACDRFEKKLYDLELTRTVSLQTAPQIRMVQASDNEMAEKIHSTIVNTIPLWKNQMVIALGIEHSLQASKAQREVSDMTNKLLTKNADALKTATVETAKESQRGIVDIETLKHTNEQLISTLDEVMTIQKEGKEKRQEAEKELSSIEQELKNKLMEASRS
ncbi:MAG: toxic anion resistance protein [Anaerovoracaceae bacterium]|jgi:uncharacterized protein YaaN involved in tellurite resistance